ncbi:aminoglycoside phosphotransferase family protein [Brachybacterium tyrofermentans]|uniref:aminoglycoside phosphotransferase family protein n=1 Tax=Brachybacterium tyrofermentans TaxID=47848 RepID=UPI003FD6417E
MQTSPESGEDSSDEPVTDPATELAADLGLVLVTELPSRSSRSWRAQGRDGDLVLRQYLDLSEIGQAELGRTVAWQAEVRRIAAGEGWPTALPHGEPIDHAGSWWTLEQFLPGRHRPVPAATQARILTSWHATTFPLDRLGPRPGAFDALAVLDDEDVPALLRTCAGPEDRSWLQRRFEQVTALADGIDRTASRRVLVHGDLVDRNLLWDGERLTGVLDLELATVDRRTTEMTTSWRCRYDELAFAVHRLDPFSDDEWPMLLVDWWTQLITLSVFHLRRGRQPDRWELDGLRRETALSRMLERGEVPRTD